MTPAAEHVGESLNTVKFASRAKRMRNRPIVNELDAADTGGEAVPMLKRYRDEIRQLQQEKASLERRLVQQDEDLREDREQVGGIICTAGGSD